jgi:hypothetical protein
MDHPASSKIGIGCFVSDQLFCLDKRDDLFFFGVACYFPNNLPIAFFDGFCWLELLALKLLTLGGTPNLEGLFDTSSSDVGWRLRWFLYTVCLILQVLQEIALIYISTKLNKTSFCIGGSYFLLFIESFFIFGTSFCICGSFGNFLNFWSFGC